MRIDPDICTDPALLAAEVRRLQAAVQSLPGEVRDTAAISGAGKSAEKANTPPTLTDAEREAIRWFANYGYSSDGVPGRNAATLRGLLERTPLHRLG
jgi:hypothetical protein